MTRLELLQSYPLYNRRDTWVSFGSAQIDSTSIVFFKNSIFRLVAVGVPLNGAIIFTSEDYTLPSTFDWQNMHIADITSPLGEIIDETTNIISPHFNVVVTQAEFQAIIEDYDPTFIPFQEVDASTLFTIDDDTLNQILLPVGVPFIKLEELEFTRDQIINYILAPAIKEYYKFFPITHTRAYPMANNTFSIPLPETVGDPPFPVFTALKGEIIPGVPMTGEGIKNPLLFFFDEVLLNVGGGANGGFTTPGYATSRRRGAQGNINVGTTILEKAVRSGIVNYSARNRIKISVAAGMVSGYSTIRGNLELTYACYSTNFSDINYNRKNEVIQLCSAKVLTALGMLRSQQNSEIPGSLDYSGFITKGKELEDRIINIWEQSTKGVVVRLG